MSEWLSEMASPSPHASPPRQNGSNGTTTVAKEAKDSSSSSVSPLKAAADLIQTLDLAYTEMTHCAADAAKDVEEARRNARTASEIARRYMHRSYPKVQTSFGGAPSPKASDASTSFNARERNHTDQEGDSKEFTNNNSSGGKTRTRTSDPQHALNGVVPSKLPPPPPSVDASKKHSRVSMSPSRSRAGTYHNTSSADRIAQSHAEDVFTLAMELERAKQALQSEQRMHDDTKAALSTQRVKAKTLEEENKKLKRQMEQIQRENDQKVAELEHELAKSKHIVEAAEEDAQLALDLAKESSEKRDEMESELLRAMEELKLLKEQPPPAVETPRRSVRFADESSAASSPAPDAMVLATPVQPKDSPSRTMVAAGRQLLRRSAAGTPNAEVIVLELTPAKSAERRQRLRERLVQLEDGGSPLALMPATPPEPRTPPPRHLKESDDCRNAARLLQESGRRLELAGHWWRKGHLMVPVHEMEAMTRQFCQSVEFKVDRQRKEINELESLCGFLERKLVVGNGENEKEDKQENDS